MALQPLGFGNGKLPFDILGVVFRNFLEKESILYPFETLLLVCWAWHSAALAHKSLWGSFHIQLRATSDVDFNFWEKCISRRLLRCPLEGLIDVQIRISEGADHRLAKIISALAGESNIRVKNWRKFCIRADPGHDNGFLRQYLSLNTPRLEDFELHNIYAGNQMLLPYAPLLNRFHTSWFPAPYPDLRKVTEITVSAFSRHSADNKRILAADNVVTLCVEDYFDGVFRLPREFPALRHLSLQGRVHTDLIVGFSAPRLQTLALSFVLSRDFRNVSKCEGINFKNIEELKLGWWNDLDPDDWSCMISEIRILIEAAVNIRILWVWNRGMARLVLKLLEDLDCFQHHSFTLRYAGERMEITSGEHRLGSVAEFRGSQTRDGMICLQAWVILAGMTTLLREAPDNCLGSTIAQFATPRSKTGGILR